MLSTGRSDMTSIPPPRCLERDELAAFIDGTLDTVARQGALSHLDACPECYELLAESARALDAQPGQAVARPQRRWPVVATLAAAAGLTALLVHSPAHSPDRPGLSSPGPAAEVQQPAPAVAADPVAALLATASPSALASHTWSGDEASLVFAPASERYQALLAGVFHTDLAVATQASRRGDRDDLRERVAAAEPARRKHPEAFALGALAEAGRLAAAVRNEAFFADGSVRERLREAAGREPDPPRQRALQRLVQALGGDAPARPWARIQSGFGDTLGQ
jgi:hypothetical protein